MKTERYETFTIVSATQHTLMARHTHSPAANQLETVSADCRLAITGANILITIPAPDSVNTPIRLLPLVTQGTAQCLDLSKLNIMEIRQGAIPEGLSWLYLSQLPGLYTFPQSLLGLYLNHYDEKTQLPKAIHVFINVSNIPRILDGWRHSQEPRLFGSSASNAAWSFEHPRYRTVGLATSNVFGEYIYECVMVPKAEYITSPQLVSASPPIIFDLTDDEPDCDTDFTIITTEPMPRPTVTDSMHRPIVIDSMPVHRPIVIDSMPVSKPIVIDSMPVLRSAVTGSMPVSKPIVIDSMPVLRSAVTDSMPVLRSAVTDSMTITAVPTPEPNRPRVTIQSEIERIVSKVPRDMEEARLYGVTGSLQMLYRYDDIAVTAGLTSTKIRALFQAQLPLGAIVAPVKQGVIISIK